MSHIPVLLNEILEAFNPQPGQSYIDATANGGGHTFAIWERVKPDGKILAIDKDCDLINNLQATTYNLKADGIIPVCGSYADLKEIVTRSKFTKINPVREKSSQAPLEEEILMGQATEAVSKDAVFSNGVNGILFDLGYSSHHLEQSGRGFSFQKDEPLIMRYETDPNLGTGLTAKEVVNQFKENELADIFFKYGEERHSRRIAKLIVTARKKSKIETTKQLADAVLSAYPKRFFHKIHPATKVFQALRIFVNAELEGLESVLPQAVDILAPGGKIAVISFHSLEDRIVKFFFKEKKNDGSLKIITKKPIRPSAEEMKDNPRARSAKLRVAEKI